MSLMRRKSVSGCGAIRYDCRKARDIARHQFQIDRPERLGEPRSAAGANQRDDILSLRGDPCDRRLCGRRVQRSRDRTQPFGEIEIATQVLSLKPDAEVAVIFRRQIGVEVSAQEAAREHAVGRNRNAQRPAAIQKLPSSRRSRSEYPICRSTIGCTAAARRIVSASTSDNAM
jgi:hypothetical protein